ncbi:DinB family protein [Indiicoccus explosivorum]|uniref:DinB family protein n=1 Tax=Indiicoccus explosivorum TaxID=1917864 RepID=UPI000B434B5B|nr:DinB family protein [Indiicoccus explosivorum]
MEAKELLMQQWASCLDEEDWFLPMKPVLEKLTAEQALWKPEEGPANSIWETVRHLLFYKKRLLVRVKGEGAKEPAAADNDATFSIPDTSPDSWVQDRDELFSVHRALGEILAGSDETSLSAPVPGERTLALEMKSLAMHDAYHIGQIVLLSKLQGTWPAARRFG